ncbi:hypothetical protein [Streptomyces dysideae]|uniref:Uncharacterized protein n=1 Tax=Streptomyces dysideae TaxID=909626 RepID=A0A101UXD3_9ACTN|nr:hypothetical protein AQJ91_24185 [Streptomyces dysideae]
MLEGFEHLVDAFAGLVAELLRQVPGLTVLAVGRRPLGVAGERVFAPAPLGEDEAVKLFAERATRQGVAVREEAGVRESCRRLDGIPLAIELAAERLRPWTCGSPPPRPPGRAGRRRAQAQKSYGR